MKLPYGRDDGYRRVRGVLGNLLVLAPQGHPGYRDLSWGVARLVHL